MDINRGGRGIVIYPHLLRRGEGEGGKGSKCVHTWFVNGPLSNFSDVALIRKLLLLAYHSCYVCEVAY